MRFSKVSVVTLFLLAVVVLSKADIEQVNATQAEEIEAVDKEEEELRCNEVISVMKHYRECFERAKVPGGYSLNYTDLMVFGVITRESFLAEVSSKCSDVRIKETYIQCTGALLSVCPELTDVIRDVVAEKESFLCENNQPSTWINTVLNEDFVMKNDCITFHDNEVFGTLVNCSKKFEEMLVDKIKNKMWSPTVFEARMLYQIMISSVFDCTTLPYFGDDSLLPCGAKKKDFLLFYWILSSTFGDPLIPPIGQEAMEQLIVLMSTSKR